MLRQRQGPLRILPELGIARHADLVLAGPPSCAHQARAAIAVGRAVHGAVTGRLAAGAVVALAATMAFALAAAWLASQAFADAALLLERLADAGQALLPRAAVSAVVIVTAAVRGRPAL